MLSVERRTLYGKVLEKQNGLRKKIKHFKGHSTSTLQSVFVLLILSGTFEGDGFWGGLKSGFKTGKKMLPRLSDQFPLAQANSNR